MPLSLANMDGSLRKPNKSALLKELDIENKAQSMLPEGNIMQISYIIDLLSVNLDDYQRNKKSIW